MFGDFTLKIVECQPYEAVAFRNHNLFTAFFRRKRRKESLAVELLGARQDSPSLWL